MDETGLPRFKSVNGKKTRFFVSSDSPYFAGDEGVAIAKKWYEKEFGITFQEEMHPMTVFVVGRRSNSQ